MYLQVPLKKGRKSSSAHVTQVKSLKMTANQNLPGGKKKVFKRPTADPKALMLLTFGATLVIAERTDSLGSA